MHRSNVGGEWHSLPKSQVGEALNPDKADLTRAHRIRRGCDFVSTPVCRPMDVRTHACMHACVHACMMWARDAPDGCAALLEEHDAVEWDAVGAKLFQKQLMRKLLECLMHAQAPRVRAALPRLLLDALHKADLLAIVRVCVNSPTGSAYHMLRAHAACMRACMHPACLLVRTVKSGA
eukprot:353633-Chlamydomonas_euryale.AAC.8